MTTKMICENAEKCTWLEACSDRNPHKQDHTCEEFCRIHKNAKCVPVEETIKKESKE